jgi:hypothetical protein
MQQRVGHTWTSTRDTRARSSEGRMMSDLPTCEYEDPITGEVCGRQVTMPPMRDDSSFGLMLCPEHVKVVNDAKPVEEPADTGFHVWWTAAWFAPAQYDTFEAVLPDGTRLVPHLLPDGHRLGFDRSVPSGTELYREGRLIGVVGH